ncbi:hypothetical protein HK102_002772 [Quaeritorhiza haematococci]|nr:hypothetical protein HK102_002772 [Quaeritorhiza haematococci]
MAAEKKPVLRPATSKPLKRKRSSNSGFRAIFLAVVGVLIARYFSAGIHVPIVCSLAKSSCPKWSVHGHVSPGFENVMETFRENFELGHELGASFVAYAGGEKVLELYGGYFSKEYADDDLYDEHALQLVFSTSKAVTGIAVAYLVDQGVLDYKAKISQYWPEFAQNKKENVTLEDLMAHRAGMAWLDGTMPTIEEIGDMEKFGERLAAEPHKFNGSNDIQAYHAVTRGWIINQVVRRADPKKRTVGQILREEILPRISTPEDKAEFYLGLPEVLDDRVSLLEGTPLPWLFVKLFFPAKWQTDPAPAFALDALFSPGTPTHKTLFGSGPKLEGILPWPAPYNNKKIWRVESPSFSGITNAKSLAKLGAIMANAGKLPNSDVQLLSREVIEDSHTKLRAMNDSVMKLPNLQFSRGGWGVFPDSFFVKSNGSAPVEGEVEWFGWSGAGGSCLFWNPTRNVAFAYVMNAASLMPLGDTRSRRLLSALGEAVERYYQQEKQQRG